MSPKAPANRAPRKLQVSVCLAPEDVERVDALRVCFSTPARDATRSDVLREAIRRGLEDMEARAVLPKRTPPPRTKR
jgi:predicted DNA-binding protein